MKKPTHKELIKAIKNLIEQHGGFIYKHYRGGPIGMNGIADLIGVYRGRGLAIEVKTGKDKLTTTGRGIGVGQIDGNESGDDIP